MWGGGLLFVTALLPLGVYLIADIFLDLPLLDALSGIVPPGADLLAVVLLLTESPELDSGPEPSTSSSSSPSSSSAVAVLLSPAAAYATRSWVLPLVGCHLPAPDPRFAAKEEDVDAVLRLLLVTAADEAPPDSSAAAASAPGKPGRNLLPQQQLHKLRIEGPMSSGGSSVCIVAEPGQAKCALAAGAARRAWDLGCVPGGCFLVDLQTWLGISSGHLHNTPYPSSNYHKGSPPESCTSVRV